MMEKNLKAWVEEELDTLLPKSSEKLIEAARYSLFAPAKRIRPLFTLLTAQLCDPRALPDAIRPACALEIVHTSSLIHDDLPCMDDDDFRRGQPSLHRVYNEGHAVLVGDYLLALAFEVLATAPSLKSESKLALIQILSQALGAEGMVGGQVFDLDGDIETEKVNLLKTASLFQAAFQFGGVVANASPESLHRLKNIGTHIGLLFQAVDDIKDGESKAHPHFLKHYSAAMEELSFFEGKKSSIQMQINSIIDSLQNFSATC
jgi:geranylgeranyl diphosphate synthase, type II